MLQPRARNLLIPVHSIYNPVEDTLHPDGTPINPHKLFLASTPYKGLEQTLEKFSALSAIFPQYELYIATYARWDTNRKLPARAIFLGSLPQKELLQHIRESFCVFYPQSKRCETFGLVYAQSNAVGTPVLAHDFGAAREVLSDPDQLVDGNDLTAILNKITAWQLLRPRTVARAAFRLKAVTARWHALLNEG